MYVCVCVVYVKRNKLPLAAFSALLNQKRASLPNLPCHLFMTEATSKASGDGPGLPHGTILGVTADGVQVENAARCDLLRCLAVASQAVVVILHAFVR